MLCVDVQIFHKFIQPLLRFQNLCFLDDLPQEYLCGLGTEILEYVKLLTFGFSTSISKKSRLFMFEFANLI